MADDTVDLQIVGAVYGLAKVTTKVIALVNRSTSPPSLTVTASNDVFGDSWPGTPKVLTVAYRYGDTGTVKIATATEGQQVTITGQESDLQVPADVPSKPLLSVLAATYGPKDVTAAVQGKIDPQSQTLAVTANNATFSDTWPGHKKTMVVVAAYTDQVPFVDIVIEGNSYSLKYRPPFQIISAAWGLADVTAKVQTAVSRRALTLPATVSALGIDGWPGVKKSLCVVSQYADLVPRLTCATEGSTMTIDYDGATTTYDPAPDPRSLNVIAAAYGPADVTSVVTGLTQNDESLSFTAGNATFTDKWPGVRKSFSLTYAYGPGMPSSFVVPENSAVNVTAPPLAWNREFFTLAGLIADGDLLAFQASNDMYWAIGQGGQITATAAGATAGAQFVARSVAGNSDQLSLQAPDGSFVIVGTDGTLHTGGHSTGAATFVTSLTTGGAMVLSVVGSGPTFCKMAPDGSILAFGTDVTTLDTNFSISIKPTAEGTANHLAALGLADRPDDLSVSPELLKVIWDLTGGWFLALGLGPRIADTGTGTGILALIRTNAAASAALDGLFAAVLANPEASWTAAFLAFEALLWNEDLGWPILRMVFSTAGWIGLARLLTKILEWTILPQAALAEAVISFAFWGYTTTMDVLAYVNSTSTLSFPEVAIE